MRKLSARFNNYPLILSSQVAVLAVRETKYFVNTEGTRIMHGRPFSRVILSAQAKALDGMDLSTFESFNTADAKALPKDSEIEAAIERIAKDLSALLDAPLVDAFIGPAILSGRAAGVFFHEIFGHRVEGHRQKDETDGQTFAKSVDSPVLPEFHLGESSTRRSNNGAGQDLNGWYSI